MADLSNSLAVRKWIMDHPGMEIPSQVLSEGFLQTHSLKYFETVLTQSGHKIKNVKVLSVVFTPASDMATKLVEKMDAHSDWSFLIHKKLKDGSLIPLDPHQPLPVYFAVEMELAPL